VSQLSQEYPITVVCQVLEVPRSSLYDEPVAPKEDTFVARVSNANGIREPVERTTKGDKKEQAEISLVYEDENITL
jgi:hypothetical protein